MVQHENYRYSLLPPPLPQLLRDVLGFFIFEPLQSTN